MYQEERSGGPIPFDDEAFDGFATSQEVLALVGPILGREMQPPTMMQSKSSGGQTIEYGKDPRCKLNRVQLDYFTNYLYNCVPFRELNLHQRYKLKLDVTTLHTFE